MGRIYTCSFTTQAETVAVDFFELITAADTVVIIHRVNVTQNNLEGDAVAEMLPITFHRYTGSPNSGSGGVATTPIPLDHGDAAAGFTCETTNTTAASSGTAVTLHAEDWNIMGGFDFNPDPEDRIVLGGQTTFVVRAGAAPDGSTEFSGTLVAEELG